MYSPLQGQGQPNCYSSGNSCSLQHMHVRQHMQGKRKLHFRIPSLSSTTVHRQQRHTKRAAHLTGAPRAVRRVQRHELPRVRQLRLIRPEHHADLPGRARDDREQCHRARPRRPGHAGAASFQRQQQAAGCASACALEGHHSLPGSRHSIIYIILSQPGGPGMLQFQVQAAAIRVRACACLRLLLLPSQTQGSHDPVLRAALHEDSAACTRQALPVLGQVSAADKDSIVGSAMATEGLSSTPRSSPVLAGRAS